MLDAIKAVFPGDFKGFAVDVGACDGVFMSKTIDLEIKGWKVLCIEPNPLWKEKRDPRRKLWMDVACGSENLDDQSFHVIEMGQMQGPWSACSALKLDQEKYDQHKTLIQKEVTFPVSIRTLDWCLNTLAIDHVDFLQTDCEGGDFDVIKGFDVEKFNPALICCENWYDSKDIDNHLAPFGYVRVADDRGDQCSWYAKKGSI